MHSDHGKNQEKRNSIKPNENALNIEVIGQGCNISNNFQDSIAEITSISSFTHESQRGKTITNNIKEKLFQKLNTKPEDVIQGLKNYDKHLSGKILPVNLYNVLRIFCFPLSLNDFSNLIKEIEVDENGFIRYKSFLYNFVSDEKKLDDLWFKKENGIDTTSLSTEDLEIKIRNKISKNIKNFIRCLWLHDFNNDGLIQKDDLKTVLENICFPLTDDQFNRFWNLYDPVNSGIINYKDFLVKLGTHTEAYRRTIPMKTKSQQYPASHASRYSKQEQIQILCAKLGKDDPAVQGQLFNRILDVFKTRVKNEFPLLLRTLQVKDSNGSGYIPLSVFHQVLNYFVMPMSFQLFKEILRSFNIPPNISKIAWYSFLKKVSVNGDVDYDPSTSPMQGSVSWNICKSLLEKLKRNGKNEDNFFKNAFTLPTPSQKLAVTRAELRRIINQSLVLPVNEEEFKSLLFILDPGHTNFIDCESFLALFRFVDNIRGNQTSKPPEEELVEETNQSISLKGESLKKIFKKSFNKNFKNIEKALHAFDHEETGAIKVEDLKKILSIFTLPLTDKQFYEIIRSFLNGNTIFYGDFINYYKKSPYEDEEKWKNSITKLMSPKVTPKQILSDEDVIKYVKDIIINKNDIFLKEFQDYDLCNTGSVRKEVLYKLLQKYAFRLTDSQFQELWQKLPKNEIGFLKYQELLKEWCIPVVSEPALRYEVKTPCTSRSNSAISLSSKNYSKTSIVSRERPKTASSVSSVKSMAFKVNNRPKSAASVSHNSIKNLDEKSNHHMSVDGMRFENCGILTKEQYKQFKSLDFGKLENTSRPASKTKHYKINNRTDEKRNHQNEYEIIIKTRWRDILRRCKAMDHENHDVIMWDDFLSILQRTGIDVSEETMQSLETKYNIKRDFPVNYWIVLKKFLVNLNSDDSLKGSEIKTWHQKQKAPVHESVGLCKVLLNFHDKIMKNYRDLHHAFRRADIQHTGELNILKFRKILTFHKIYLTDNDLFYVQDYFDPNLTEKIPYNKFLKAFIKK